MITLQSRAEKLANLLACLRPQLTDDVELLQCCDNGERQSGAKRNELLFKATGDYVAFIDDDDLVADDYVQRMLAEIEHKPDVITFRLRMSRDGKFVEQKFGLHEQDGPQWGTDIRMTANHICAWRRELATMMRFPDWLGYGDDQFWYKPLIAAGVAKTERHIDHIMYYYTFSRAATANQTKERVRVADKWVGSGIQAYWMADRIVMDRHSAQFGRVRRVYDAGGREFDIDAAELKPIALCYLK